MQLQERERKYPPPPTYKLTFEVKPITAKVELKKNDANEDPVTGNDNVFSNLPPGNYYYSVSATGYITKTGTVEITDKDVTQKIDLTLTTYTLTFNVTPTGSEVILKENDANGNPVTGNDNVFSNLLPGNYYYTASQTGYISKTGVVEITNANKTENITLEVATFANTLAMENAFGAYHWVYFETKILGAFAFTGKLYFLLKEKGNAKPSVDDMTRHPNRMNRSVTITQEEATQGTAKTLTKNFTGLSGDAVVNANYEFAGDYLDFGTKRLEGVGHVLADGAKYTVWVLPVATDATGQESDIFSLGEITAGKKADVQSNLTAKGLGIQTVKNHHFIDTDIFRLSNDPSVAEAERLAIEVGPGERLMIPFTVTGINDINSLLSYSIRLNDQSMVEVIPPLRQITVRTRSGSYNSSSTLTPANSPTNAPEKVFYSHLTPPIETQTFADAIEEASYSVISTTQITNSTITLRFEYGNTGDLSIPFTKVP